MYVGRKKVHPKKKQFFITLMLVIFVWLFLASLLDRSPVRLIMDGWHTMIGTSEDQYQTYSQLKKAVVHKDSLIATLTADLEMIKKAHNYKQGLVAVESENLNVRESPLIGASVLFQLPVGAIVEILYYDDETFRLGGEYGKWCKIRYAGKEGWVWGNYIEVIN